MLGELSEIPETQQRADGHEGEVAPLDGVLHQSASVEAEPAITFEPDPDPTELIRETAENSHNHWLVLIAVIVGSVASVFFVDVDLLLKALGDLKPWPILFACICSVASFFIGAYGLRGLTQRPWVEGLLDQRECLQITALSQLTANLLSVGGITGAVVRARLLAGPERYWPEGLSVAAIFTLALNVASLAITVAAIVIIGLTATYDYVGGELLLIAIALVLPAIICLAAIAALCHVGPRLTQFVFFGLSNKLAKRLNLENQVDQIKRKMELAIADQKGLVQLTGVILVDWYLVSLTLYFALIAVGEPLPFDAALGCFGVAGFVTLISFVPGGVGTLEASLATIAIQVYQLPREEALVAVVLYRLIYYVTPLPLSFIKSSRRRG